MKSKMCRMLAVVLSLVLSGSLAVGFRSEPAGAACSCVSLDKKATVRVGESTNLSFNVKNCRVKRVVSVSLKKAVASVKATKSGITITGKKEGKTTVITTVRVKIKALIKTCILKTRVTVTPDTEPNEENRGTGVITGVVWSGALSEAFEAPVTIWKYEPGDDPYNNRIQMSPTNMVDIADLQSDGHFTSHGLSYGEYWVMFEGDTKSVNEYLHVSLNSATEDVGSIMLCTKDTYGDFQGSLYAAETGMDYPELGVPAVIRRGMHMNEGPVVQNALSDENGRYHLYNLPAGYYTMQVLSPTTNEVLASFVFPLSNGLVTKENLNVPGLPKR